jgi:hypothetical protein
MTEQTSEQDLSEFRQMMEEELERVHPTYSDYEPPEGTATTRDGSIVPITDRDQEMLDRFAEEFDEELQGKDSRKMMFVLDVAILLGETPDQLRELIDEEGFEAAYQVRMAIHLASKELGVTYQEAGEIVSATIWGTEKGTRLQ